MEDKELKKKIGPYWYSRMEDMNIEITYSNYLSLMYERRQIRNFRQKYGYQTAKSMQDKGFSLDEEGYKNYCNELKAEKKLKNKIGKKTFNKYKKKGLSNTEILQVEKQIKEHEKQMRDKKNKTRWMTYRFIERNCDLEMRCQICGTTENIQIHHPNYNDYLKINLLCTRHHGELHKFELIPPPVIDLNLCNKKEAR